MSDEDADPTIVEENALKDKLKLLVPGADIIVSSDDDTHYVSIIATTTKGIKEQLPTTHSGKKIYYHMIRNTLNRPSKRSHTSSNTPEPDGRTYYEDDED